MYRITLNAKNPYEIIIKDNILYSSYDEIKKIYQGQNLFIITDQNVSEYHLEKLKEALKNFKLHFVILPGGEEMKSLAIYEEVCRKLLDANITRGDMLVAFGGGVIGDLTGFVAATLFRGLPFIQIPTTLLAMVDSSIGGKTGIDFEKHKNILGAFWQPKLVIIDPLLLKTLPDRELKNGYGEIIKHALISSSELFDLLHKTSNIDEKIIYQNLLIKKELVEKDEFDRGERMKLNFGHTFGHIIELKNHLLHGEAVLSGILSILDFEIDHHLIDKKIKDTVLAVYKQFDLNYLEVDYHKLLADLQYDKKNFSGVIKLVLLNNIGSCYFYEYKEE